jgi:hypothetical protein
MFAVFFDVFHCFIHIYDENQKSYTECQLKARQARYNNYCIHPDDDGGRHDNNDPSQSTP